MFRCGGNIREEVFQRDPLWLKNGPWMFFVERLEKATVELL